VRTRHVTRSVSADDARLTLTLRSWFQRFASGENATRYWSRAGGDFNASALRGAAVVRANATKALFLGDGLVGHRLGLAPA
jgi:hypothetical protein